MSERLTREQFLNFKFCHGCVDDEPFCNEAYELLDERDAAVAIVTALVDAGWYLRGRRSCWFCEADNYTDDDPGIHAEDCAYLKARAFLATLAATPSPAVE